MDKKELKSIARFYKDCEHGFATDDGYYAVPIMGSKTKLMVINDGELLKECRNELSARNYIKQLRKQRK
tara:strand:+ start:352 stop:558 length:207 start_codon:yes stop_codon:yes gene_type:complete